MILFLFLFPSFAYGQIDNVVVAQDYAADHDPPPEDYAYGNTSWNYVMSNPTQVHPDRIHVSSLYVERVYGRDWVEVGWYREAGNDDSRFF